MTLKQYLIKQLWITLSLALITGVIMPWLPAAWQTMGWIWSLILFYFSGAVFFGIFLNVMNKKQHAFANFFLISTGIKLLLYLIFIVVYLLINRSEAKIFLLLFMIYYAVFAIFESRLAVKMQKPRGNFKPGEKQH
ncbi:MAG TPA: hypothetical protein PKE03_07615 [Bacteroidales bacterium]|nr:hypothetical protein [Bacteroidales bacterium]